jgi:hypothetical protein
MNKYLEEKIMGCKPKKPLNAYFKWRTMKLA